MAKEFISSLILTCFLLGGFVCFSKAQGTETSNVRVTVWAKTNLVRTFQYFNTINYIPPIITSCCLYQAPSLPHQCTVRQKLAVKSSHSDPRPFHSAKQTSGNGWDSSAASNWCPLSAPIAHSWLYRPVKELSGKADQLASRPVVTLHRYFLCVGMQ